MSVDVGDTVTLTFSTRDVTGALANAGQVTATVTLPDGGTVSSGTLTPYAIGSYGWAFVASQVGRHLIRWVATGANAAAQNDVVNVEPNDLRMLVGLDDAKAYLGGTGAPVPMSPQEDEQLRRLVAAATPVIEELIGPVLPRTVTETLPPAASYAAAYGTVRRTLLLGTLPVLSLASATDLYGGTVDTSGWTVTVGGMVTAPGYRDGTTVTYLAGLATVPPDVQTAALELVASWWRARRGGSASYLPASDDSAPQGDHGGVTMWRIKQMLAARLLRPVIA